MFGLRSGVTGGGQAVLLPLSLGIVIALLTLIIAVIVTIHCVKKRRTTALGDA